MQTVYMECKKYIFREIFVLISLFVKNVQIYTFFFLRAILICKYRQSSRYILSNSAVFSISFEYRPPVTHKYPWVNHPLYELTTKLWNNCLLYFEVSSMHNLEYTAIKKTYIGSPNGIHSPTTLKQKPEKLASYLILLPLEK